MTTVEFLDYLRNLDVKVWAAGDRLRYSAPQGTLTSALHAELVERKAEILNFLRQLDVVTHSRFSPIVPVGRDRVLPLSFAQQRLWFLDRLQPGSPVYNIPTAFRLAGQLNVAVLEQSLSEIAHRHEALRTTFTMGTDGQPAQVVAPATRMTAPIVELEHLSKTEREAETRRLAVEEARRPFDLTRGPLLRTTLLRMGKTEHILLLTMHHIVSDGWSEGLFLQEMTMLYKAFLAGKPSPLPELPLQYADFAVWQREWLSGEVLEPQLAYWKEQLGGELPVLELPTDRPRLPVQTFRGTVHSFAVSKTLHEALKVLSQQEGVTLFMTLLAAFKVLLYRYTEQTDILVGTPIANRNRSEIEGLIGFFVNTLVLRTDLSGNPTFRDLLGRVREVALGAYTHQNLPFGELVEALQPQRDLSYQPLFQVMFVLQNALLETQELPGLTLMPLEVESGTAKFDLTLFLRETEHGLAGRLEYSTDLFDAATMTRMAGHFQTLLAGIITQPKQPLSELPLLTETERQQLLIEWNDTTTKYPQEQCIHQLFEAQVKRTPDAVAVVFEEEQLTYQELNLRANQLAHYLQTLDIGPEILVGIYMERSLEMVVGLLGVLKAGGAYVPLDPQLPPDRLAFILAETHSPVLLTQQQLAEKLPELGTHVICLDTSWKDFAQASQENCVSKVIAEDLVYVIFTSGSTGQPKGVAIEHRQLFNYLNGILARLELPTGASLATVSTLAADLGNTAIFPSLCTGGCLHMISQERAFDPNALADYFCRYPIDFLKIVPSHMAALLTASHPEQILPGQCLVLGGEATGWDLIKKLLSLAPDCAIFNHYGPTETTVGVTTYRLAQDQPKRKMKDNGQTTIPLGRPMANIQIYLLDSYRQPVPIGVPGELYISGNSLGRGYLNRPDLTAEKFIPNPFSDKPGAGLYKTGDLARYLPDGNIEFLGRIDYQVKIRGFRIEMGEIETVLAGHPAVRETIVIAREDQPGDKCLVAYLVPDREQTPAISELRSFLKEKLPDYMIPSAFVILEILPLTSNGKIDRSTLPAPEGIRPQLETAYVVPRFETERFIANVWREKLRVDKVGIYDNLFDLGGHSLLTMQIYSKLQKRYGQELSLVDMFQYPTIHALAQYICQKQKEQPFSGPDQDRTKRYRARKRSKKRKKQLRQKYRSKNKSGSTRI